MIHPHAIKTYQCPKVTFKIQESHTCHGDKKRWHKHWKELQVWWGKKQKNLKLTITNLPNEPLKIFWKLDTCLKRMPVKKQRTCLTLYQVVYVDKQMMLWVVQIIIVCLHLNRHLNSLYFLEEHQRIILHRPWFHQIIIDSTYINWPNSKKTSIKKYQTCW